MHRRELLKTLGATAALAAVPHEAAEAWARVAAGWASSSGLTDAQLALIGAIADTILPRTDTPSATDVKVPAFVDVIVSENYTDAARATFITGLDTLATSLKETTGASFVDQTPDHRAVSLGAVERADRRSEPGNTYWRLKGLVIHGYFTSERVMKDVLHTEIMPGRFDGAAHVGA